MADSVSIEIVDNTPKVLEEFHAACLDALEDCGKAGEGFAVLLCPVSEQYGGTLRDSITHQVVPSENAVYIGTNNEYSIYVELGTGKYYPGGRQTPWVYQDKLGNWHLTYGQRAQPYIKPAVADNIQTFKTIIENNMKKMDR